MCLQWWVKNIGGMSDLCLYELEDNVWDEFGESDDHIVPHPNNEHGDRSATDGDSRKKPWCEVIGITSNADTTTRYGIQGKEKRNLSTLTNKDIMLEKGSWSHTPDGMFPSCDADSIKEVTSIASDNTRMSSHSFKSGNVDSGGNEFCTGDPIMGDGCTGTAVDNSLYRYPLSQISQTGDDLSFFDNDQEDEENGDLLYYGWPDIGNFEDVDRMFRSCDSTFGLGSLNNEDELCWFSSSNATRGSEDELKSDFKFSSSDTSSLKVVSEHHEDMKRKNAGPLINGLNKKSTFKSRKMDSQCTDVDDTAALGHVSFENRFDAKSESRHILMPKEQINLHKKQANHHNVTEGKKIDGCLENGGSFNPKQVSDLSHPHGDLSFEAYSTSGIQQHKQSAVPDSMSYMQTDPSYRHLNYSHVPDQISVCQTPSGTQSDNNGHPSSLKESSYASNQVQSMEGSCGPSVETPAVTTGKKREKLYSCQNFQSSLPTNLKNADKSSPMPFCGKASAQKQVLQSDNEIEGHSDVEGVSIEILGDLDSSNIQESSCVSTALDKISLEATSFRQLQQVMEQLDIRTKLCIRDSLYRLARSAEQRHNCANQDSSVRDNRDASGALMAQETNKCAGFMDIETNTNPIDRSIAHLLFHRPSDPSAVPASDSLSLRSHTLMHESVTSPSEMLEKQVCQEETPAGAEK